MEQTTVNADDLGRVLHERDTSIRQWRTALRQYGDEQVLRRQWQDRAIRAETLLRRCVTLAPLPCELRRQIATALDSRPCGCGPMDGCEKCRKPGALFQAIVRLWFRRPDGSAPNPLTDPPDEEAGVMQPTREGTEAFLREVVLRHWDGACDCQPEAAPAGVEPEIPGRHRPDCTWRLTLPSECEYRTTHEYCPHPAHACSCATGGKGETIAWLIEAPPEPGRLPQWWATFGWTTNANAAMRFGSRAEADEYLHGRLPSFGDGVRATEHVFIGMGGR